MPEVSPAARRVLLVEDEPSLRTLMRRMLQNLGYSTIEARNGREGLEVAAGHEAPLDLLITDVVMPEMDGFELATRLTLLHGETKVLFLTGHSSDFPRVHNQLSKTPHAFLLKPFTQVVLQSKIHEILAPSLASAEQSGLGD